MIGNPITLTNNVASKTITTTATAGQTNFTVAGGYRINQISVFRNGVKLASDDYQARDGITVVLTVAANNGDTIEFQVFDDFKVANALDVNTGGNIGSNVTVNGTVTATSFIGNLTGSSSYATTAGVATIAQGLTGSPNISVGVITATRIVGDGSGLSGIQSSTFSNGFIPTSNISISTSNTISNGQNNITLADDIIIGSGVTFTVSVGSSVEVGGVRNLTVSNDLTIPGGSNSQRPSAPVTGSIRYNSNYQCLEVYIDTQWFQIPTQSIDGRGVFGGGYNPALQNTIDYITIATTGNATDFGDLTVTRRNLAACSSSTRGVFGGGYAPANQNTIDYITIATTGNATDFGDLTVARGGLAACSNYHGGLQ